jgi:hypothetical protein
MHCYVRKSSIYPSPAQCLWSTTHVGHPFLHQFLSSSWSWCPNRLLHILIACPAVCITLYLPRRHQLQQCCCKRPVVQTEQHMCTDRVQTDDLWFRLRCESRRCGVLCCVVMLVLRPGSKYGACAGMWKSVQMQWYYSHKDFGGSVMKRRIWNCNNYMWKYTWVI